MQPFSHMDLHGSMELDLYEDAPPGPVYDTSPSVSIPTTSYPLLNILPNDRSPLEQPPTDFSDTTESDVEAHDSVTCPSPHEGRDVLNMVLPMTVDQLFTLIFTYSKFFKNFHESRRTTDISPGEWEVVNETGVKSRKISMRLALNNPMGPKQADLTETQTMNAISKPGMLYSIDVESVNSGVPYADAFYVMTHFCLSRINNKETSFLVCTQIKYRKSVWGLVKTFIEKNTNSGIDEFYEDLQKTLLSECGAQPARKKRKTKKSGHQKSGLDENEDAQDSELTSSHSHRLNSIAGISGEYSLLNSHGGSILLLLLIILLLINSALYYKLWSLETKADDIRYAAPSPLDIHIMRNPPKTAEEWLHLLQRQEMLHQTELEKWQDILKFATKLLRQTEESLSQLQRNIYPHPPERLVKLFQESLVLRDTKVEPQQQQHTTDKTEL